LTLVDKYMIIPWQELPTETLENIVESVVLREGTDYGSHEFSLEQKKQHLLNESIGAYMSEDVELLEEQKLQDDDQQRDPALDWFLTHCHLHKYPAKSTLIHAGEDANILYFLIKDFILFRCWTIFW